MRSKRYCSVFIFFLVLSIFYGCGDQRSVNVASVQELQFGSDQAIAKAFHDHQSGIWVESKGTVEKILDDDREGDPHQRFILRLSTEQTILIAHNIAVSQRISGLEKGNEVKFRGRYEWNNKGGIIHWTHHDSQMRESGGWLEHKGQRYN